MKLIFALPFLFVLVSAQHGHHHLEEYVDYRAHPHYNYHYGVHDPKKHDVHDQWEARDGHNTKGGYSLQQPDGRKRIVEYEADKHGIHYKVKYEGHAIHEEGHHGAHGKAHSSQYYHGQTNYHGEEKGHGGGDEGGHYGGGGGDEGGHYGGGEEHGHAISHTHQESGHGGGGGNEGGHYGGGEEHGHAISHTHQESGHGGGGGGGGESGGHLSHKIVLVHVGGHGGHGHGKAHSSQFYHGQTNYHGEEKGHGGHGGHEDEGGDDGGHGHEVATSYKSQVENHYGHHHHH